MLKGIVQIQLSSSVSDNETTSKDFDHYSSTDDEQVELKTIGNIAQVQCPNLSRANIVPRTWENSSV
jgi:hypothetical protein